MPRERSYKTKESRHRKRVEREKVETEEHVDDLDEFRPLRERAEGPRGIKTLYIKCHSPVVLFVIFESF